MSMTDAAGDFVQRFLFEDLDISGVVVCLRESWQRMHARRNYRTNIRDLLGELAAVTALIGSNLKRPGKIPVQLRGNGPLSLLLVECTESLRLRGMARAGERTTAQRLIELFGDGQLALNMRGDGAGGTYQSIVPLDGESVSEVFEHYLSQSVQQPASLMLAADDSHAVGLLLQKLPGADRCDTDGWARITQLAATVTLREIAGLPPLRLLPRLFPGETLRLFDARPVRFHCPLDWDKVRRVLRSLGREEVDSILRENGEVVIHDEVCNHAYRFDAAEVAALFPALEPPPTLH